ncbi:response regulator [Desulfobaculum bizertense]|uniref:Response regulator receiver domain-containing protein n=1 Tax=Desulfobaculum bizertense DSM 18034 TaxID=1121442 RepID=A0A1T4VJA5_9BACT|nr:response regulator [Desulfobaculum bizertense]UIJ37962.1 response regulator [Desulfobaculum bizertense]SKA65006.1 Response regulator receiver domain-containing protein [Desulfobaculum bizertense DSM 18034]
MNDLECRLLLVDDERAFSEALARRLTHRGAEVMCAASGEEAVAVLKHDIFDVVVLDVKMPGIGGMGVLKHIRKYAPETEVIMLTGHADMDDAIRGMELGAYDYLLKPVNFTILLHRLQDATSQQPAEQNRAVPKERTGTSIEDT